MHLISVCLVAILVICVTPDVNGRMIGGERGMKMDVMHSPMEMIISPARPQNGKDRSSSIRIDGEKNGKDWRVSGEYEKRWGGGNTGRVGLEKSRDDWRVSGGYEKNWGGNRVHVDGEKSRNDWRVSGGYEKKWGDNSFNVGAEKSRNGWGASVGYRRRF
ncbi:unnamed protein product [Calicophoron daubneyi]|uniref:Uncharacterized protein n=1 Tax=Calicophoron daubneyi TaxID=300641 RepID=A0AAV2TE52_CALDB